MPEEGDIVLICVKPGEIDPGQKIEDIIVWTPLPEPYRNEWTMSIAVADELKREISERKRLL